MIRGIAALLSASLALPLGGCAAVVSGLAGEPHGLQGAPKTKPVTPFGLGYATENPMSEGRLGAVQAIMPPTIAAPTAAESTEETEPVGSAGPRPPIAVVPLSDDPARIAGLGAAARRAAAKGDQRFVLLVLTPPAAESSAIAEAGTRSRAAAAAALKAIQAAGVDPSQVEISAATSQAAGSGEMRLYVR